MYKQVYQVLTIPSGELSVPFSTPIIARSFLGYIRAVDCRHPPVEEFEILEIRVPENTRVFDYDYSKW